MSLTVTLQVPIEAHGETVTQLNLRRPTVQEVRAIKSLPYKIGQDEEVKIDTDVAAKYIAVCAAIPSSSVNQLDLSDLNDLAWAVTRFFMNAASAKSPT